MARSSASADAIQIAIPETLPAGPRTDLLIFALVSPNLPGYISNVRFIRSFKFWELMSQVIRQGNMEESDTKTRLLDAAENLFGRLGIAETSLRAITTEAGANLAAVNYHFGSKEALVEQTFVRRLEPLNLERLRLLDEAEALAGESPPCLEAVVTAFVGPTLRMRYESPHGDSFLRLMGRLYMGPSDFVLRIMDQFDETFTRFSGALQRALPDLSSPDLAWRFFYMIGSMTFPLVASEVIKQRTDGLCDPKDVEAQIDRLVSFISGGLRAPGTDSDRGQTL